MKNLNRHAISNILFFISTKQRIHHSKNVMYIIFTFVLFSFPFCLGFPQLPSGSDFAKKNNNEIYQKKIK